MITKNDVRKIVKQKRMELCEEKLISESKAVSDLILSMDAFKKADTVFSYAAVNGEVDTRRGRKLYEGDVVSFENQTIEIKKL